MPLEVISCFSYRTSLDSPWTDAHHSVNQFVDALKDRPVKGYGHVLINGQPPKRLIEAASAIQAKGWFGEMGAQILSDKRLRNPVVLVPVPNSECTLTVRDSRTAALAHAVQERTDVVEAIDDFVRWDQVMPSASKDDGPRHPAILFPHLRIRGRQAIRSKCSYVIIDDVLTSGGHLRAVAALLRSKGARVAFAICGARADSVPQTNPFERRIDELEDFEPS
jgi:hypothetical protein